MDPSFLDAREQNDFCDSLYMNPPGRSGHKNLDRCDDSEPSLSLIHI